MTLKTLPEPGVDVYIKSEEVPDQYRLARLETNQKFFALPRWPGKLDKQVPVRDVTYWDYAMPAGDLLC
jgi:hypothetical protein